MQGLTVALALAIATPQREWAGKARGLLPLALVLSMRPSVSACLVATVKVRWMDVAGDRCWQTSGILDAKKLAAPAIVRIERMVEPR